MYLKQFNYYVHILLLRCLLLDISDSLFRMAIMLSPLFSRMLIYIFLLLSIIVIFYNLFGTIHHISRRFYLLVQPQPQGISAPSLNLSCSFAVMRVSILLSIWMTFWSSFTLSGQVRGLTHFCALYWFGLELHINFSKSDLHLTETLFFGGFCWDTVHMSASLPPDKLADIQQLALSLLQTQHVTVCQVMSFLDKAIFCANGYS